MSFWYEVFWELGKFSGCHQMPERSFFVRKKQFPVCARCTGAFIGYIAGSLVYPIYKIPLLTSLFFCIVLFVDWFIQRIKIKESTNLRRFITGLLCGFGLIQIYLNLIVSILQRINYFLYII